MTLPFGIAKEDNYNKKYSKLNVDSH